MLKYLVIDIISNRFVVVQSCQEVARITQIDLEEIEIALEEHGLCETDKYTIAEIAV